MNITESVSPQIKNMTASHQNAVGSVANYLNHLQKPSIGEKFATKKLNGAYQSDNGWY